MKYPFRKYVFCGLFRLNTALIMMPIILSIVVSSSCHRQRRQIGYPGMKKQAGKKITMEPIVIQAKRWREGKIEFESYDAQSLFEKGLDLLDESKPQEAIKYFFKILQEFPNTSLKPEVLFDTGFAYEMIARNLSDTDERNKNLELAIRYYDRLLTEIPQSPYVVDTLFRKGYCLEEMGKTQDALSHYGEILNREKLSTEDIIEAKTRIGSLYMKEEKFDIAEEVLRENILFFTEKSKDERIENSYYAAKAQFGIGEIYRKKFEKIKFSADEAIVRKELKEKLSLMMKAKDAYVEAIKIGNYTWATASGYRVGLLFKTLYTDIMHAKLPPSINTDELKKIYYQLLRKKALPLLKSAIRLWEKTLLMAERVGYNGIWVKKIEEAVEKTSNIIGHFSSFEYLNENARELKGTN